MSSGQPSLLSRFTWVNFHRSLTMKNVTVGKIGLINTLSPIVKPGGKVGPLKCQWAWMESDGEDKSSSGRHPAKRGESVAKSPLIILAPVTWYCWNFYSWWALFYSQRLSPRWERKPVFHISTFWVTNLQPHSSPSFLAFLSLPWSKPHLLPNSLFTVYRWLSISMGSEFSSFNVKKLA